MYLHFIVDDTKLYHTIHTILKYGKGIEVPSTENEIPTKFSIKINAPSIFEPFTYESHLSFIPKSNVKDIQTNDEFIEKDTNLVARFFFHFCWNDVEI